MCLKWFNLFLFVLQVSYIYEYIRLLLLPFINVVVIVDTTLNDRTLKFKIYQIVRTD